MFKMLTSLMLGVSLSAVLAMADLNAKTESLHFSTYEKNFDYAVLSNQIAVTDGNSILWLPSGSDFTSSGISVDGLGNITLPHHGLFLVDYTVRITKSPYDGTATAIVQLQQTVAGVPANITQAAITSTTTFDVLTSGNPQSDTQISGYALINTSSDENNVINLIVTLPAGTNLTIPAASGTDANAQMVILQLR